MNWAEIGQAFINATKQAEEAAANKFLYLNEGYRNVCSRVDVRELESTDETISTTSGQDYTVLPANVFSIIQVDNTSTGRRIEPEPSGIRGRSQFLNADSGAPPSGAPQYYVPSGSRLFLRPTPDAVYTLRIRYKKHPEKIDETMEDQYPELPEHLHIAIAYAAAVSFMNLNPSLNEELQAVGATYSMLLQKALDGRLTEPMLPKDRERYDQSGRQVIPGFSRFRSLW